jgi:integrase/recombinase XerD
MVELVPGYIPKLLTDPSVGLFRADERVFEAMVEGWRSQMMARGLTTAYITNRLSVIRRFQAFTGTFPWQWNPADIEDYLSDRRSGAAPITLSTLRGFSNGVAAFCSFVTNPAYGWAQFCAETFGEIPSQICFEWNTPRHTADDAVPPRRRAFSKGELQRLFDHIDDLVDREHASGSKRWLRLHRDSVAFKLCYAFGLRRRELTKLEIGDFGPNPHVPAYGRFGAVTVRWAKGTAASGPRRRTVLTVPEFEWVVPLVRDWLSPGRRDRFKTADRSDALWPSERGGQVTVSALGDSFAELRTEAGLPAELGLHCLRHSYVTHLIEAGYDPTFVQTQVGHAYASTTGIYTSVSADFKQKAIQTMIAKRIATREDRADA